MCLSYHFAYYSNVSGEGLQCYTCTYNRLLSDNDYLNFVLKAFNSISNEHCKLLNPDDKFHVAIRTCPTDAGEGYEYRCGNLDGTVHSSIGVPLLPDCKLEFKINTQ